VIAVYRKLQQEPPKKYGEQHGFSFNRGLDTAPESHQIHDAGFKVFPLLCFGSLAHSLFLA